MNKVAKVQSATCPHRSCIQNLSPALRVTYFL